MRSELDAPPPCTPTRGVHPPSNSTCVDGNAGKTGFWRRSGESGFLCHERVAPRGLTPVLHPLHVFTPERHLPPLGQRGHSPTAAHSRQHSRPTTTDRGDTVPQRLHPLRYFSHRPLCHYPFQPLRYSLPTAPPVSAPSFASEAQTTTLSVESISTYSCGATTRI